jgi:hypothetical protein
MHRRAAVGALDEVDAVVAVGLVVVALARVGDHLVVRGAELPPPLSSPVEVLDEKHLETLSKDDTEREGPDGGLTAPTLKHRMPGESPGPYWAPGGAALTVFPGFFPPLEQPFLVVPLATQILLPLFRPRKRKWRCSSRLCNQVVKLKS